MKNNDFLEGALAVIIALMQMALIVAIIVAILGLPTMLLWNWLMPMLFGLTKISFIEALGVNMLSAILFRGFNVDLSKN